MKKILLILLLVAGIMLSGCSGKGAQAATSANADTGAEARQGIDGKYYEKGTPLESADAEDVKSLEITPSGDPKCFLSPCDCNCYFITNVPLTAKKITCGVNCRGQYGITGCVYRGDKCVALK